jgi:hypothetical protein
MRLRGLEKIGLNMKVKMLAVLGVIQACVSDPGVIWLLSASRNP